ncbi:recombinase RecT [Solidesulfovibrio sp.]|uniref:recombinase RecT n=1 Tax=Solidesulfovibrio sp. TaxID=2910990 RepID=UPI0026134E9C|nr:recombinase RecT [Solidesulfovibrio sp.]
MATTSIDVFRGTLKKMEGEFALVLPKGVTPETFTRVVMTAVQSEPTLMPHLNTDQGQRSMIAAAMKCAQDGLMPDKREAAFVVYKGQPQYMPMIGGVRKKLMATGLFNGIPAHVVYENDHFVYELGDNERLEHRPVLKDRGEPIAVYAIAIFKDGYREREVMTVEDIEKVRAVSAAQNGPWKTWWDQMAIKTVTKRLAKRLPVSREVVEVLDADREEFEGTTYDVTASPVDVSEFDRLAQARGADMGALSRFTVATASMNKCPVDDVKAQAIANFDSFWAAFETWQTKQPAANGNGQKKPRATASMREGAAKAVVDAGLDLAAIEKDFGVYSKDWSHTQCEQAKKLAADALSAAGVVPDPEADADSADQEQPAETPQDLPETVECPNTGNVVRLAVECAACGQMGLCPSTDGQE